MTALNTRRTESVFLGTPLEEVEKELILKTLKATDNNKAETARRLGVDVKTIRNKLKRWEASE